MDAEGIFPKTKIGEEAKLLQAKVGTPNQTPKQPYPPYEIEDEDENDVKRFRTPKSRARRNIKESEKSSVKKNKGDSPVKILTYTNVPDDKTTRVSDNVADRSGADCEAGVVVHSGNFYVDFSIDRGTTFKRVNPTTVFPANLAGGFCCDQVILYVPKIDRFVWYMQHKVDSTTNSGAFRLALASPEAIKNDFQSAWYYWDFLADDFGLRGFELDYPDLASGDTFLYVTSNVVGKGRIVLRLPLKELGKGIGFSYSFTDPTLSPEKMFQFSHLCQNSNDGAFWAGHKDNATIRIFSLPDSSGSYVSHDVAIAKWPHNDNGYTSVGPDNVDWLDVPWADDEISGATRSGNIIWLAWTATKGKSDNGSFDFPNPHCRVVSVNIDSWRDIGETQIWNPDYAFAYPFLSTNSQGEVGVIVGWGGKNNFANSAFGILGDFVLWFRTGSEKTPDRFGDYLTVRRSGQNTNNFAGFGYYTIKDSSRASGYYFDPFYVVYGR